ncbi:hypothetical protein [Pseudonocardia xinjiangensis]|uniref:DUF4062 domain-containing protein n=1 Tax=Pseudonocardia xinjiangensis TaxID=75289 RepID=A0ABX1R9S0_9PSEU|nr:hypothetical protein [Pseudonocardia xinjiangensis]NMH77128.1 hypothetical protein [Pseudonocardia xinjiangensis]
MQKAINRWNGIYGPSFGSAVIPISWGSHAAAEFGRAPQAVLNDQLVDGCDICVALFANRMGTPTAVAESGTAEEIQRLHQSGRYVGILRSRRFVDPATVDHTQAQLLDNYLLGIQQQALVLEYRTDAELENHIDAILVAAITRDRTRSDDQVDATFDVAAGDSNYAAEVWPRVESADRVSTSSNGRVRTRRNWYLVLSNTGKRPAREVRFSLESDSADGEIWHVHTDNAEGVPNIEVLAPHGHDARFPILATMGSASQVRCRVTWIDDRGEQENIATLRLS